MKAKLALAIFLMILSGRSYATSDFTLSTKDGSDFYVIMDGEIFDPAGSILNLSEVRSGNHSLDVYRYIRDARGFNTRYVELFFRGNVFLDDKVIQVSHLTSDGRLIVFSKRAIAPGPEGGKGNGKGHGNSGYNSHNGNGGSGQGNNGYNGNYGASVMNSGEFTNLKKSIRSASFEQTKLTIAKDAITSRSLSSEMVYEIMSLFSFEATKLEFAKWAYVRTTDPYNYYLVNRAFSFDASIQDLSRWISVNG